MVFRVREALGGFKHLSLKWTKHWQSRPDTLFIKNYEDCGLVVERFEQAGKPAVCPVCGYALIRLNLDNGWVFETCSAFPAVKSFSSTEFKQWAQSLPAAKLPTSCV